MTRKEKRHDFAQDNTRKKRLAYLLLGLIIALSGCQKKHVAPQKPSQRNGARTEKIDSTTIALVEMNQRLAEAADKDLVAYVEQDSIKGKYAQLPVSHAWVRIIEKGDEGERPRKDEVWRIHIICYNLKGEMLFDSEKEYAIGKKELPLCIEESIRDWGHGTKASVIAPWYAAYGMTGNEAVEGYENVKMEIRLY